MQLSLLWIFVMFNMLSANIVGFLSPEALSEIVGMKLAECMILACAVLIEIPILMIVLTMFLEHKINRKLNILAGIIAIISVIDSGNFSLSYLFFASVEVVAMLYIIRFVYIWRIETYQNA